MKTYKCSTCPMRARHDAGPTSFVGRFWRWHINFCPGWKAYFNSLSDAEKMESERSMILQSTDSR